MMTQRGLAAIIMVSGLVAQAHENAGAFELGNEVAQALQIQQVDKDHLNIFISVPLRGYNKDKKDAEKEEGDEGSDQGLGGNALSAGLDPLSALCATIEKDSEYKKIVKRTGSLMFKTSQVVGALMLVGNFVWAHQSYQALQTAQDKNSGAQSNLMYVLLLQGMRAASIPSALVLLNSAFGGSGK
jgi:hypothetical protein